MAKTAARQARLSGIQISFPVKHGAGVGLASGRNIAMPVDPFWHNSRVNLANGSGEPGERFILGILEREIVGALHLNTDGEIVGAGPPFTVRLAGVPSALMQRHELDKLAIASNQDMGGNFQILDFKIIRILAGIQGIAKKLLDAGPTEKAWGETD
jgi:hypothetical protein